MHDHAFPVVFFRSLLHLELGRDCLIFPVAEDIDDANNTRGLSFMRWHLTDKGSAACVHTPGQRPKG